MKTPQVGSAPESEPITLAFFQVEDCTVEGASCAAKLSTAGSAKDASIELRNDRKGTAPGQGQEYDNEPRQYRSLPYVVVEAGADIDSKDRLLAQSEEVNWRVAVEYQKGDKSPKYGAGEAILMGPDIVFTIDGHKIEEQEEEDAGVFVPLKKPGDGEYVPTPFEGKFIPDSEENGYVVLRWVESEGGSTFTVYEEGAVIALPRTYPVTQWKGKQFALDAKRLGTYHLMAEHTSFEGVKTIDVVAINVVDIVIDEIQLPNDFIALPDKVTATRIASPGLSQTTTTEMKVTYSIRPIGFSLNSVRLKISMNEDLTREFDLTHTSGLHNEEKVVVQLGDDWQVESDDRKLEITLSGRGTYLTCRDITEKDGKRLLHNLDFNPQAYKEDSPVCPYTNHQDSLTGAPEHDYYGLLMTYDLNADMEWDTDERHFITISGGEVDRKVLDTMPVARKKGHSRKVKWECYDNVVSRETPATPVVPPARSIPQHLVREGAYGITLVSRSLENGLEQVHCIEGVRVFTEYDLENVVK